MPTLAHRPYWIRLSSARCEHRAGIERWHAPKGLDIEPDTTDPFADRRVPGPKVVAFLDLALTIRDVDKLTIRKF